MQVMGRDGNEKVNHRHQSRLASLFLVFVVFLILYLFLRVLIIHSSWFKGTVASCRFPTRAVVDSWALFIRRPICSRRAVCLPRRIYDPDNLDNQPRPIKHSFSLSANNITKHSTALPRCRRSIEETRPQGTPTTPRHEPTYLGNSGSVSARSCKRAVMRCSPAAYPLDCAAAEPC